MNKEDKRLYKSSQMHLYHLAIALTICLRKGLIVINIKMDWVQITITTTLNQQIKS
jgi:hypothetical protein